MKSQVNRARWWFVVVPALAVALYLLLWGVADAGRTLPKDGVPAVARVLRSGDGRCIVGAKRQHCYHLSLELHVVGEAPSRAELDVNIEDRWAHRVQAGAWLRVVRDRQDPSAVFIDVAAFDAPAPSGSAE